MIILRMSNANRDQKRSKKCVYYGYVARQQCVLRIYVKKKTLFSFAMKKIKPNTVVYKFSEKRI